MRRLWNWLLRRPLRCEELIVRGERYLIHWGHNGKLWASRGDQVIIVGAKDFEQMIEWLYNRSVPA